MMTHDQILTAIEQLGRQIVKDFVGDDTGGWADRAISSALRDFYMLGFDHAIADAERIAKETSPNTDTALLIATLTGHGLP